MKAIKGKEKNLQKGSENGRKPNKTNNTGKILNFKNICFTRRRERDKVFLLLLAATWDMFEVKNKKKQTLSWHFGESLRGTHKCT